MKTFINLTILIVLGQTLTAQSILTNPNKRINGQKTGLWTEFTICDTIDFSGEYHAVFDLEQAPTHTIQEGYYRNNKKQGFWKEFWILKAKSGRYIKGRLKSIKEYNDDVQDGLLAEYYQTGSIKAIGHYKSTNVDKKIVIMSPNWKKDPTGQIMKTRVLHVTRESIKTGDWHFFEPDGTPHI